MLTNVKARNDIDDDGDGDKIVASVHRALSILDAFLEGPPTLSLADLALRTGLYKSTIARLVLTMEQDGYMVRSADGGFHIGSKPLRLANLFQNAVQPEYLVLPVLKELVDKTRESASFMIRQGQFRITLYRVDSPQTIRDHGAPGDIVPLGKGATSKVFDSFTTEATASVKGPRKIVHTTTGANTPGMTGVAAPVFGAGSRQDCVGVIVLTGPEHRLMGGNIKRAEKCVMYSARTLTERLGGDVSIFDKAT